MDSFLAHFSHPHAPNLSLVGQVSPVIKVHLIGAVIAFAIGAIQIFGPKGTGLHRVLGWTWVLIMMVVAFSSLFIRIINHGAFSFIHILSGITLVSAPLIIYYARRHDVKAHSRNAVRLYIGALLVAGLFTFAPGRLVWAIFFG